MPRQPTNPSKKSAFLKLTGAVLVAGLLLAGVLAAPTIGAGSVANHTAFTIDKAKQALNEDALAPAETVMLDKNNNPFALLYDQRRLPVSAADISVNMKLAIVSIEDRRFFQHNGVDYKGTVRALVKNAQSDSTQGGSTLEQQYIKNYRLFALAKTAEEQTAATEQTVARKITEAELALELDKKFTKDEILAKYLNIVPFGNQAYGIQVAAQTYFGKNASDLTVPESAMLAGIVRASEYYNPYVRPNEVLDRRNTVLDAMASTKAITPQEAAEAKKTPLGVLPSPKIAQQGCIGAGDAGFFCAYALSYLENSGLDAAKIKKGGYRIKTTLDPAVQKAAATAAANQVDPKQYNVANVINLIKPGKTSHDILAMASSRQYGLNANSAETTVPLTFSQIGDGAGSTFKIFTAAAAMQKGVGIKTNIPSPARLEVSGMGTGGAAGCPENKYCVTNDGSYPASMTLQTALAESPNTAFVNLIRYTGVSNAVDMAVRLGLRSYAVVQPGAPNSIADGVKKRNTGAFTLGYTPVNPLEMANVSATLASGGTWCEPNPILSVTDGKGQPVAVKRQACEQVVDTNLANSLAQGMSQDAVKGTAAGAASAIGWTTPIAAKTGTTESHRSAAFVGFNSNVAGFSYVFSDGDSPQPVCSFPARICDGGSIYGGSEPARTWMSAVKNSLGTAGTIPPATAPYINGSTSSQIPNTKGMSALRAKSALKAAGYQVVVTGPETSTALVVAQTPTGAALAGTTVTITTREPEKPKPKPTSTTPTSTEPTPDTPSTTTDDTTSPETTSEPSG